jgi:hypothetical protein
MARLARYCNMIIIVRISFLNISLFCFGSSLFCFGSNLFCIDNSLFCLGSGDSLRGHQSGSLHCFRDRNSLRSFGFASLTLNSSGRAHSGHLILNFLKDFLGTKLELRLNERVKLRLWLKILAAKQCNSNECCGNFTPTCLFI